MMGQLPFCFPGYNVDCNVLILSICRLRLYDYNLTKSTTKNSAKGKLSTKAGKDFKTKFLEFRTNKGNQNVR